MKGGIDRVLRPVDRQPLEVHLRRQRVVRDGARVDAHGAGIRREPDATGTIGIELALVVGVELRGGETVGAVEAAHHHARARVVGVAHQVVRIDAVQAEARGEPQVAEVVLGDTEDFAPQTRVGAPDPHDGVTAQDVQPRVGRGHPDSVTVREDGEDVVMRQPPRRVVPGGDPLVDDREEGAPEYEPPARVALNEAGRLGAREPPRGVGRTGHAAFGMVDTGVGRDPVRPVGVPVDRQDREPTQAEGLGDITRPLSIETIHAVHVVDRQHPAVAAGPCARREVTSRIRKPGNPALAVEKEDAPV